MFDCSSMSTHVPTSFISHFVSIDMTEIEYIAKMTGFGQTFLQIGSLILEVIFFILLGIFRSTHLNLSIT